MIINLKKVLESELDPGQVMCPVFSQFELIKPSSFDEKKKEDITLTGETYICVGRQCGMFNRCFNIPGTVAPIGPAGETPA